MRRGASGRAAGRPAGGQGGAAGARLLWAAPKVAPRVHPAQPGDRAAAGPLCWLLEGPADVQQFPGGRAGGPGRGGAGGAQQGGGVHCHAGRPPALSSQPLSGCTAVIGGRRQPVSACCLWALQPGQQMDPGSLLHTELALLKAVLARSQSQHGACTYSRKLQQVCTGLLPRAATVWHLLRPVDPSQVRRCLDKLRQCAPSAPPRGGKRSASQAGSRCRLTGQCQAPASEAAVPTDRLLAAALSPRRRLLAACGWARPRCRRPSRQPRSSRPCWPASSSCSGAPRSLQSWRACRQGLPRQLAVPLCPLSTRGCAAQVLLAEAVGRWAQQYNSAPPGTPTAGRLHTSWHCSL